MNRKLWCIALKFRVDTGHLKLKQRELRIKVNDSHSHAINAFPVFFFIFSIKRTTCLNPETDNEYDKVHYFKEKGMSSFVSC